MWWNWWWPTATRTSSSPSEDGKARLTCWENEEAAYDIREEDGRLYIEKIEQRQNGLGAWFGFHQKGKLESNCLPARMWIFPTATARCGWTAARFFPTVTIATDNNCARGGRSHHPNDNDNRGRGKCDAHVS